MDAEYIATLEAENDRLRQIIRTQIPFGWVLVGALGYDEDDE